MAKKPATKKTKPARAAVASRPAPQRLQRLYKERYPDRHDLSGKYIFLFLFFALTTLIFALTTIYLYSVAHDIIRRYDHFIQYNMENNRINNSVTTEQ